MSENTSRIMTTRELAEYIKLNEKTIIKMAQNREIPGVKIGAQWRFHLAAIDKYIQNDVLHSSDRELDLLIQTGHHTIPLSRLTSESLIELNLSAGNRDEVLKELSELAFKARLTSFADKLYDQLEERENMLSTAIGQEVAIPHARTPLPELFKKPNIIIARSVEGVDFEAEDNQKVHLFIMPCSPNEFVHVRLLAKISKFLRVPGIIEQVKKAVKKEDVIKMLISFEQSQILPNRSTTTTQ